MNCHTFLRQTIILFISLTFNVICRKYFHKVNQKYDYGSGPGVNMVIQGDINLDPCLPTK